MRKAYSNQLRLDTVPIPNVELNLQCRDRIVPVLRSLQQFYSNSELTDHILALIAADINEDSRTDTGRKGMDYWHICVLAAVRLGCDYTYDQLQNFSENHRDLRAIMGLGSLDETEFHHKTLRNTFCLLRPETIERMKPFYREILQKTALLTQRARDLCMVVGQPAPKVTDVFGPNTPQAFIVRTERVADTARRRVIEGKTVANCDKLFSIFEPHTQLYKRGKAGQPVQFGRQVLVFEDAAGFLVRGVLMNRDEGDKDVAVRETKFLQETFDNNVKRLSFDRGFHAPENQKDLSKLVSHLCLPKPGAKQSVVQQSQADEEFVAAAQNHPGVESAIGALQSGNALKRCRDRSEVGFERYVQLAILGRNLHTLGRLLIANKNKDGAAGRSRRKAA